MSFASSKELMKEGDTVLLYLGYDNLVSLELKQGSVHQSRFGALKHARLIGAPYGVKVDCSKGWVYPLQPTAELWTLAVPHRTQILYTPDISMIVLQLHLKPGSVVIEAGTGSGSLSHALIRSIMPAGKLHTFEFHAERCSAATKEFDQHGLADNVIAKHRDVCSHGFDLNDEAEAVFLDLPSPWECVGFARQALKSGGRICTFSPCMEQVQRTCVTLREQGFSDLTTLECLARPFSVQNVKVCQVSFGDEDISPQAEQTSRQVRATRGAEVTHTTPKVPKCDSVDKVDTDRDQQQTNSGKETEDNSNGGQMCTDHHKNPSGHSGKHSENHQTFKTGAPQLTIQGHTGFLTFASMF